LSEETQPLSGCRVKRLPEIGGEDAGLSTNGMNRLGNRRHRHPIEASRRLGIAVFEVRAEAGKFDLLRNGRPNRRPARVIDDDSAHPHLTRVCHERQGFLGGDMPSAKHRIVFRNQPQDCANLVPQFTGLVGNRERRVERQRGRDDETQCSLSVEGDRVMSVRDRHPNETATETQTALDRGRVESAGWAIQHNATERAQFGEGRSHRIGAIDRRLTDVLEDNSRHSVRDGIASHGEKIDRARNDVRPSMDVDIIGSAQQVVVGDCLLGLGGRRSHVVICLAFCVQRQSKGLPMSHVLEGITVIDLSRALAGPFAAMTLGDMGADVLKVEEPGRGDPTRDFPPFWGGNGESCYYLSTNRNKRSLTLNLETDAGREIVKRLIADADILIESFRTGMMERWGLGWDDLHALNPRLIYCAVSAVGRDGPDKDRAGVDLLMQAYAGLMSITGEEDGEPVRTGTSVVDLTTGANAVQGILAALYVRERAGQGQRVDVSLLGSLVTWLTYHAVGYFGTGKIPGRMGSRHGSVAPYGAFPTNEGYLVVAVATDPLWRRFCQAVGRDDLIDDPRFARNGLRIANRAELEPILVEILSTKSADDWAAVMDRAGVPCSPINTIDRVLNLPQVLQQELVIDLPRDDIPAFRMPGIAIKLSDTPGTARLPPPRLGEHTEAVLAELGFGTEEIATLRSEKVV
jgi:crotonobetainyl-CoA:carnitine CoA-transferase CaiB-like acyl-CoA transferase